MLTQNDIDTLGLPKAEVDRISKKMADAGAQFQKTCNELKGLTDKAIWVHLEVRQPQVIPADSLGAKADLVRHSPPGTKQSVMARCSTDGFVEPDVLGG